MALATPTSRRRIVRARAQAALYYARRRTRSCRSDAALFRTHTIDVGGALDAEHSFPSALVPVTFEGVVRLDGTTVTTILDTGAITLETTATGGLLIRSGSFVQEVAVPVGREFRFDLAVRPGDAEVRLWLDADVAISTRFGDGPLAWHDGTTVSYTDTAAVELLSPLSIYQAQRPRHFGEAEVVLPGGTEADDTLYRAAIATFLTDEVAFLDIND